MSNTDHIVKFYPDVMYEKVARDPGILGFDPWLWAREPLKPSGNDYSSAYFRSEHGRLLYTMVLRRKAELMEAFFPLRTSAHTQSMSWPEVSHLPSTLLSSKRL